MRKLLFGTNNSHKLKEIREIVGEFYEILDLQALGKSIEVEETEPTLEGNAKLKAKAFYDEAHIPCFSDDTGLEVEALHGKPGVHTARYAGDHCSAADNMAKLLEELRDTPNRAAQFRTVIAFYDGQEMYTFEGIVRGRIATQPMGLGGFGYDPVFIPFGYVQTFAEMEASEKHGISHRGKAIRKFAHFLSDWNPTQS